MKTNSRMEPALFCRDRLLRFLGRSCWPVLMVMAGQVIFMSGCGRPQGILFAEVTPPIVWPRVAEKARIKYVGQLNTEDDLKAGVSGWEMLRRTLFGRKEVGTMVSPCTLAQHTSGGLYITDTFGSIIHSMNLVNRRYGQFSETESGRQLLMPVGLCIVGEQLFVTDSELGKVFVFDLQGRFVFSFGEKYLTRPVGIAYNKLTGKIYVSDTSRHLIYIFDRRGEHLGQFGGRGTEDGQFNFPTHLWICRDGKLYVSDTLNYRIQVFSPREEFLFAFGGHGNRPGYFDHPSGVATDSHGNIYVIDKHFENIQIFDSAGRILLAFGSEGTAPGEFWLPRGIFIDANNRIFVADSYNKRVQVFQLLEDTENVIEK